jgi:hypothetical protein
MSLVDFHYVDFKKFFSFFLFSFFSGENKKILLQSGKSIPKSLWWKIEATFLISFFGGCGGGDVCQFAIFLRET